MIFLVGQTAWGGGGSRPDSPQEPVSFLNDVAPVLARHCVACHNPKKSESKYDVTTFVRLAKGGEQGKDVTLEPGQPDESRLVELLRHDGQPRMPLNQDPLPNDVIALIERWVREGARYDGDDPNADWCRCSENGLWSSFPNAIRWPCPFPRWLSVPMGRLWPRQATTK